MLGLAAKYGLSDVRDCLLLGILYGHVLYREFGCSVLLYFILGSFHCSYIVFLCVHCLYVSVCCTLCVL